MQSLYPSHHLLANGCVEKLAPFIRELRPVSGQHGQHLGNECLGTETGTGQRATAKR